jgi:hypothetical protein
MKNLLLLISLAFCLTGCEPADVTPSSHQCWIKDESRVFFTQVDITIGELTYWCSDEKFNNGHQLPALIHHGGKFTITLHYGDNKTLVEVDNITESITAVLEYYKGGEYRIRIEPKE